MRGGEYRYGQNVEKEKLKCVTCNSLRVLPTLCLQEFRFKKYQTHTTLFPRESLSVLKDTFFFE